MAQCGSRDQPCGQAWALEAVSLAFIAYYLTNSYNLHGWGLGSGKQDLANHKTSSDDYRQHKFTPICTIVLVDFWTEEGRQLTRAPSESSVSPTLSKNLLVQYFYKYGTRRFVGREGQDS